MASVVEMIQKLSLTEKSAVSVKAVESDYILDITSYRLGITYDCSVCSYIIKYAD